MTFSPYTGFYRIGRWQWVLYWLQWRILDFEKRVGPNRRYLFFICLAEVQGQMPLFSRTSQIFWQYLLYVINDNRTHGESFIKISKNLNCIFLYPEERFENFLEPTNTYYNICKYIYIYSMSIRWKHQVSAIIYNRITT